MKALYIDIRTPSIIAEAFTAAYNPTVVYKVTPSHMFFIASEGPPGTLLTTVGNRDEWAYLPPHVKLEVWNGREPAPVGIMEWALMCVGVPKQNAKSIVKRGHFALPCPSKKWADEVLKAHNWLDTCEIAPTPMPRVVRVEPDTRYSEGGPHSSVKSEDVVAFDIETTGLNPRTDKLLGVSVSEKPYEAVWYPVDEQGNLPLAVVSFLASDTPKVAHGGKFDYKFLKEKGYKVINLAHDTHIMAYVLQTQGSRGLKALAEKILKVPVLTFDEIVPQGKTFDDVDRELQIRYACQDADLTLRLYHNLRPRLEAEGLYPVYENIEMPLVPILGDMELRGAPIHRSTAEKLAAKARSEMEILLQSMEDMVGEFNPNNPGDLRHILYEKLGLDPIKETKTGYSVDKYSLDILRDKHPFVALLLEYRVRQKQLSTYLGPILDDHVDEWSRVYADFNQTVTTTGRLSSSRPNLQNQPPAVRPVYRVPEGHKLVAIDYSQQELRLLAHLSQDRTMLKAFATGEDIHDQTAKLLKVPRKLAKNVNFGIPYGAGPHAIARQGQCSVQEASRMLDNHRKTYPELWNWIEKRKKQAYHDGYSETITGRKRYLAGFKSNLPEEIAAAEREAVNMAVQGSAADVTKLAMLHTSKVYPVDRVRLILQVHDELVFEILDPNLNPEEVLNTLSQVMEHVGIDIGCSVPLLVDGHVGQHWGELK